MKTILILEDNDERIAAFQKTVATLDDDFELKIWRDAPRMIAECEAFFPSAALISLDHDLNPMPGTTEDPGTGLDVAKFLAECRPVCAVIIHSTNVDRAYSMHNELRFAEWIAERVGPIGDDWIGKMWLLKAKALLAQYPNTWPAQLPTDHKERMDRALLALDGLSVGNGSGVIASDTVPFCLWCAARHPNDFKEAMWTTVSGLGDRDTTCAIVGGIVALSTGRKGIPGDWLNAREAIEF